MRALITGGFLRSHLAEHLISKGYEVHGPLQLHDQLPHLDAVLARVFIF